MDPRQQATRAVAIAGGTESKELDRVLNRLEEVANEAEAHARELTGVVARAGAPYTYPSSEGIKAATEAPGALQRFYALLERIQSAQAGTSREISALSAFV